MQTASAALLADRPDKLSRKTKLGFGVADLGGNLFFTIGGFYFLNFLTESLGLAAGLAGTALMIGKIWDAVTDPAVGYISDRTHTRWGRRRPYMAVGAVFLLIFMILMFTNPRIQSDRLLFVWVVVVYCLLNTAYTLVNIPYSALTPELTSDFDERTVLNGYRMSFAVVGTLIGAGAMLPLVAVFGGGSAGWTITGGIMGVIMAVTTMITVLTVKETLGAPVAQATNVIKSYIQVLGMKTFLLALLPWTFHITGVNIVQATMLYFFQNIYKSEGMFSIALLFLLVSSLGFIPVWVKISAKIGKKKSYNIGMLIVAAAVLVFTGFGPSLPIWFSFIIMALAGIGFATQYVMPYSIVPDIIEYDFAENGTRREGVFYGMWTFASKIGQAFGIALTGWVLAAFAYQQPTDAIAEPVQSAGAITGIRILMGPIPAIFFVAGVIVLSFYPITREVYDQIMVKVRAREAANGATPTE
ncbi:MAG: MFS transporter [Spirochaetales bacterium]|nr:MFS transporter [Spirochaetales bacterium]